MPISYRAGYKYQLVEDYSVQTDIATGSYRYLRFACIDPGGLLTVKIGYAWDGPSGPVPDVPEAMRGSLVHDALYELMRIGGLDRSWRKQADQLLYRLCLEDGMEEFIAKMILGGVSLFGERFTNPKAENTVITVGK